MATDTPFPDAGAQAPRKRGGGARRTRKAALHLGGIALSLVVTLLGLIAITFFIGRVVPIDPALAVVGDRAPKAVYEAARVQLGLDKPLIVQFVTYVKAVATGDLGMSVSTGRPVLQDLKEVFPATLEMATLGIIIGIALGVPMGVHAAAKQGSLTDQVIRVVGLAGYAIPAFWLGLVGWRSSTPACNGSMDPAASTSPMMVSSRPSPA